MDELTKQSLSDLQIAVSEIGRDIDQLKSALSALSDRITNLEG